MLKSFIAALILCIASAGSATPGEMRTSTAREISRGFFDTVFGLEYGGHVDAQRVKRFVTPVRFHVADLSGQARMPAAKAFLDSLPRRIGNFRSTRVARVRDANFRVLIVRAEDFATVVSRELRADAVAMNARCLVGVTTDRGRIKSSVAVIIGDDDYLFSRCLVEEVLQGLGPMNDNPGLSQSVFNDTSHHTTFTAFDEAILNVLYHPSIHPGMTGTEAHRALPRALADLGYLR
ncbi:DUF2927 domain-containing protein [Acuticoccus sp. MNP-M23]|uniref:DUF2927 domain-containing protein n=1 Tax=Acuticoccus sp. MNP-M23 TaxID=3072793 RepID=UPI0028165373|nr:DUF2927 domain-containing protein [Acuticoccus sp. MNP-M23]WMS44116.1 DUF2927 domain-containing protein [Acuticoccus sp. MNP-M23]